MGALKHARDLSNEMSPSPGKEIPISFPLNSNPQSFYVPNVHQGLPTLIVMIVVLMIILLFCFWGAPAVRSFCKRKICCFCPMDEPNVDQGYTASPATPTIILLPFGRMLVVDRRIFTQLQVDPSGVDFMELSANVMRNRCHFEGSSASILDSENAFKLRSSPSASKNFFPPSYEEIFGPKILDLPPSYSEVSLKLATKERQHSRGRACANNRMQWTSVEVLRKQGDTVIKNCGERLRPSRSLNDISKVIRFFRSNPINTVFNFQLVRQQRVGIMQPTTSGPKDNFYLLEEQLYQTGNEQSCMGNAAGALARAVRDNIENCDVERGNSTSSEDNNESGNISNHINNVNSILRVDEVNERETCL